jgi:hypothetical protein
MVSSEQEDEECDATKMIRELKLVTKKISFDSAQDKKE